MNISVPMATAAGLAIGAVAGYLTGKAAAVRLGGKRIIYVLSAIGGAIALPPAAFLSVVAGGTLGGSYGEMAFGPAGVTVGLSLGIGLFLAVGLAFGAIVGALIGRLITHGRTA